MKRILLAVVVVAVGVGGIALGLRMRGLSFEEAAGMGREAITGKMSRRTTESVVAEVEKAKPALALLAKAAGSKLRINVFKEERTVELSSPGWINPVVYKMTAFSGKLGPKLKEGDRQIPEGIYCVEYMNPNSSYHLSFKVSYPNDFDKAMAAKEGRTNLGGDIMIHGKAVTIGCVPVGDDAIEDIFYLASAVGIKNVSVVIAPYDMRKGRKPELERSQLVWYPDLCKEIETALLGAAPW